MSTEQWLGLWTGIAFGFFLQKGRVLRFDKQVGAMLLKDMTILKFMLSAILVGMVGITLLHGIAPGKGAKRRQQADPFADLEARQAQALAALAAQVVHRMHMPRQYVVAGMGVRLMLQGERAHQQRLWHHLDPQVSRRVACPFIVIAANQGHR